ncbi:MAG TPA: hypothetical protein PKL15_00915 [Saprospiraceae bacterium]|nr:hypothetical protein [Saprospiraceae bacterium]
MDQLNFAGLPPNVHHCTSRRDGDWIIWSCPHCSGYERRLNWVSGEMRVRRGDSPAQHVGAADHGEVSDPLSARVCLN